MDDIGRIRRRLGIISFWCWVVFLVAQLGGGIFTALSYSTGGWLTRLMEQAIGPLWLICSLVLGARHSKQNPSEPISGIIVMGTIQGLLAMAAIFVAMALVSLGLNALGEMSKDVALTMKRDVIPLVGIVSKLFTFLWFSCHVGMLLTVISNGDERGAATLVAVMTVEALAELYNYIVEELLGRAGSSDG